MDGWRPGGGVAYIHSSGRRIAPGNEGYNAVDSAFKASEDASMGAATAVAAVASTNPTVAMAATPERKDGAAAATFSPASHSSLNSSGYMGDESSQATPSHLLLNAKRHPVKGSSSRSAPLLLASEPSMTSALARRRTPVDVINDGYEASASEQLTDADIDGGVVDEFDSLRTARSKALIREGLISHTIEEVTEDIKVLRGLVAAVGGSGSGGRGLPTRLAAARSAERCAKDQDPTDLSSESSASEGSSSSAGTSADSATEVERRRQGVSVLRTGYPRNSETVPDEPIGAEELARLIADGEQSIKYLEAAQRRYTSGEVSDINDFSDGCQRFLFNATRDRKGISECIFVGARSCIGGENGPQNSKVHLTLVDTKDTQKNALLAVITGLAGVQGRDVGGPPFPMLDWAEKETEENSLLSALTPATLSKAATARFNTLRAAYNAADKGKLTPAQTRREIYKSTPCWICGCGLYSDTIPGMQIEYEHVTPARHALILGLLYTPGCVESPKHTLCRQANGEPAHSFCNGSDVKEQLRTIKHNALLDFSQLAPHEKNLNEIMRRWLDSRNCPPVLWDCCVGNKKAEDFGKARVASMTARVQQLCDIIKCNVSSFKFYRLLQGVKLWMRTGVEAQQLKENIRVILCDETRTPLQPGRMGIVPGTLPKPLYFSFPVEGKNYGDVVLAVAATATQCEQRLTADADEFAFFLASRGGSGGGDVPTAPTAPTASSAFAGPSATVYGAGTGGGSSAPPPQSSMGFMGVSDVPWVSGSKQLHNAFSRSGPPLESVTKTLKKIGGMPPVYRNESGVRWTRKTGVPTNSNYTLSYEDGQWKNQYKKPWSVKKRSSRKNRKTRKNRR